MGCLSGCCNGSRMLCGGIFRLRESGSPAKAKEAGCDLCSGAILGKDSGQNAASSTVHTGAPLNAAEARDSCSSWASPYRDSPDLHHIGSGTQHIVGEHLKHERKQSHGGRLHNAQSALRRASGLLACSPAKYAPGFQPPDSEGILALRLC